jgi:hypothetical protein
MGERGQELVNEKYEATRQIQNLENIFHQLVNDGLGTPEPVPPVTQGICA